MNHLLWWSSGEEATLRFGGVLGRALAPPAWIGLKGPLGAGKTRLVQGLARGLGYPGRVRSPSFVLEHRYPGRHPIRHLDLFRLEEPGEDLEASWEDALRDIVLVEWAERVPAPPAAALWVELIPAGEEGRWIRMSWGGTAPLRDLRLERLREDSNSDASVS